MSGEKKNFDDQLSILHLISQQITGDLCAFDEHSEEMFYDYAILSDIDKSAFSYHWPYVIQSTRGRGFYYELNRSIVYFYLRKSPRGVDLVVINHLGDQPERLVCELASAAQLYHTCTIVKNIDPAKTASWSPLGFKETLEPWSPYSFRDDNSFPEFVYDVDKFLNKKFNSSTRTLINKFSREYDLTIIPYESSHQARGMDLLERNAEYLENKNVDFKNEVILAHEFVFNEKIKNKARFSVIENSQLVALSFMTHVGETLFFNAIINENRANFMRYLLWKTVSYYCEGIQESQRPRYLALQGSENEGQNRWKTFFHPFRTIHRTHITNHGG